jgi:hypothetical protein
MLFKAKVKAMKQEVCLVLVGTLTFFGMLFVAPLLVVLLACAFVIGIALVVCAQWLKAMQVEGCEPLGCPDLKHIRFVNHNVGESVPIKILPPNDVGGGAASGALVPRPPGGRPPTLKAAAALPIPPSNLRAVSLSIWQHTPQQA